MRVFITGVTGFAGSHLAQDWLSRGHELFGLYHAATSHQPMPDHPNFQGAAGDLLQLAGLRDIVCDLKPDLIFHLAGQASPGRSWDNPALTLAVNSGGTANILEAARAAGTSRVVVVTSAELYGRVQPENLPITEALPPNPQHPYGVSKLAASQLIPLYWERYGMEVVEARPFNHIGPHQALGFVVPDFASQLAAIMLGQKEPVMKVGNLSAERDFTDVRDVVRAYNALAERGQPGQCYLICSGQAVSIRTILETLIELCGHDVKIGQDPERMRPSETPRLVGSYAKIQHDTGWQPKINLRQSLNDSLLDWQQRIAHVQS